MADDHGLTASHRVVAIDQRGHGWSTRRPQDVSRAAFVADALTVVEHLELAPVTLVGQSMGGLTAFLAAAERGDLVQALIVAEASPDPDPDAVETVERWLASWPVPFPSRDAARAFFGGDTLWARTWADGLEETPLGLTPAFDPGIMVASIASDAERDYWDEWAEVASRRSSSLGSAESPPQRPSVGWWRAGSADAGCRSKTPATTSTSSSLIAGAGHAKPSSNGSRSRVRAVGATREERPGGRANGRSATRRVALRSPRRRPGRRESVSP